MTVVSLGMPPVRRRARDLSDRPAVAELVDGFGRVARDLRVSVTERCSLRCTYCMPEEGLPPIAREELLTPEEIARLVAIAVDRLGIREVRFTGGEPLMRADLEQIVDLSAGRAPTATFTLTTNGLGLKHRAHALAAAGLSRVNISLDTVDAERFAVLTRRDRLSDVLAGVAAARRAGLDPVKINAVLLRANLDDACDLLGWALEQGVCLRFIEQMPLDADEQWQRAEMVTAAELLERLSNDFRLVPVGRQEQSAPAEEWLVDGGPGTVGVIASVSRSFCDSCDRTRVTAEGSVRACLFAHDETDLRGALRTGASDDEIADLWRGAMWAKQAGHGIDAAHFTRPARSMGAIGG